MPSPAAAAPLKKAVVLPGEQIQVSEASAGNGTYAQGGKVYASILGLRVEHAGKVHVVPLSGVYAPHQGDTVIGDVLDLGPSNWTLDIKTYAPTGMHVNDVPWKVDFGDTARYIDVGETVMCKVLKVDEVKRVFLTLNGPGLRKLEGGEVVDIPHTKVGRVIGKSGATIEKLKRWTNCRIFAASNGRIWVDGEIADIVVATRAIRLIEREANSPNLTALLDAYLKTYGKEPAPEPERAAGFEEAGAARASGFDEAESEDEAKVREAKANEEE